LTASEASGVLGSGGLDRLYDEALAEIGSCSQMEAGAPSNWISPFFRILPRRLGPSLPGSEESSPKASPRRLPRPRIRS
jgi:hypothetical protein